MGGGGSTPAKNVTLQDDGSGVVKVSEDVAKRLMGQAVIPSGKKGDAKEGRGQSSRQYSAQERDAEIEKLQMFYEKRIDVLQRENDDEYKTTVDHFAKAVEEVEEKFLKTTSSPVCQDLQESVLECYQENPTHTLHCSPQVRAFLECVHRQREKILTRKG